jgi:hypothetical protein
LHVRRSLATPGRSPYPDEMSRGPILLVSSAIFACGPPDPAGEPMFTAGGGCWSPCASSKVFRDGDDLDFAYYAADGDLVQLNQGTLTPDGSTALADFAEQFGPELVGQLYTCAAVDGTDYLVTLERNGDSYTLRYCFDSEEFGIDELSEFMLSIRHALAKCVSNTWVAVGDCDPVG